MKDNKDDKLDNEYKDNKKREIEFRAKDVDDNKWVYGTPAIISRDYWMIEKNAYMEYGEIYDMYAIKQETLGQFTGICDKDGKKIYEGDIIKTGYEDIYEVRFEEKRGGWYPFACGDGCGCCEYEVEYPQYCKVVGNIYDNPELLGGSDEECDN